MNWWKWNCCVVSSDRLCAQLRKTKRKLCLLEILDIFILTSLVWRLGQLSAHVHPADTSMRKELETCSDRRQLDQYSGKYAGLSAEFHGLLDQNVTQAVGTHSCHIYHTIIQAEDSVTATVISAHCCWNSFFSEGRILHCLDSTAAHHLIISFWGYCLMNSGGRKVVSQKKKHKAKSYNQQRLNSWITGSLLRLEVPRKPLTKLRSWVLHILLLCA